MKRGVSLSRTSTALVRMHKAGDACAQNDGFRGTQGTPLDPPQCINYYSHGSKRRASQEHSAISSSRSGGQLPVRAAEPALSGP